LKIQQNEQLQSFQGAQGNVETELPSVQERIKNLKVNEKSRKRLPSRTQDTSISRDQNKLQDTSAPRTQDTLQDNSALKDQNIMQDTSLGTNLQSNQQIGTNLQDNTRRNIDIEGFQDNSSLNQDLNLDFNKGDRNLSNQNNLVDFQDLSNLNRNNFSQDQPNLQTNQDLNNNNNVNLQNQDLNQNQDIDIQGRKQVSNVGLKSNQRDIESNVDNMGLVFLDFDTSFPLQEKNNDFCADFSSKGQSDFGNFGNLEGQDIHEVPPYLTTSNEMNYLPEEQRKIRFSENQQNELLVPNAPQKLEEYNFYGDIKQHDVLIPRMNERPQQLSGVVQAQNVEPLYPGMKAPPFTYLYQKQKATEKIKNNWENFKEKVKSAFTNEMN